MLNFIPPKPNTTVIRVAKAIMPLINRLCLKGLTLDVDAESVARLKATDGHATVLVPNHAARADPAVTFLLSKQLSQQYYYMSARESFDKGRFGGLRSFLLQRFGCIQLCAAPLTGTPSAQRGNSYLKATPPLLSLLRGKSHGRMIPSCALRGGLYNSVSGL